MFEDWEAPEYAQNGQRFVFFAFAYGDYGVCSCGSAAEPDNHAVFDMGYCGFCGSALGSVR
jgi:hypothetical protein